MNRPTKKETTLPPTSIYICAVEPTSTSTPTSTAAHFPKGVNVGAHERPCRPAPRHAAPLPPAQRAADTAGGRAPPLVQSDAEAIVPLGRTPRQRHRRHAQTGPHERPPRTTLFLRGPQQPRLLTVRGKSHRAGSHGRAKNPWKPRAGGTQSHGNCAAAARVSRGTRWGQNCAQRPAVLPPKADLGLR